MTAQISSLEPFARSLEEIFTTSSSIPNRCKAWNRLQTVGLPTRRHEAYCYLPISSLMQYELVAAKSEQLITKEMVQEFIHPECKDSCLVFIDGELRQDLSSLDGISDALAIYSYPEALKGSYRNFLQKKEHDRLEEESDPLCLVNLSLSRDGAFLFLPRNQKMRSPLQLLFLRASEKTLSLPRVHIALGAFSEGSFITRSASLPSANDSMQNAYIDISLDDGAVCQHTAVAIDPSYGGVDFLAVRAAIKKDARLLCMNIASGSKLSRQDYHMTLLAEGGDVAIEGLSWLKGNDHSHVHVVVDHKAAHCTSNQHIKMVLSDASRSSFTGKIVVQQIAQKTVSYQLNNNLLLSDSAQACSKPGLQILADDVKASHGATFCQLDEEQLFYLRSRGLTEEAARSLLLFGFCNEIIERVSLSSLQKTLREKIQTLSS